MTGPDKDISDGGVLIVASSSSSVPIRSIGGSHKRPAAAVRCSSPSRVRSFLIFFPPKPKVISYFVMEILPLRDRPSSLLSVGSFGSPSPPHFPGISHERLRRARARAMRGGSAVCLLSCKLMRCIFSTVRAMSLDILILLALKNCAHVKVRDFVYFSMSGISSLPWDTVYRRGGPHSHPTDREPVFTSLP